MVYVVPSIIGLTFIPPVFVGSAVNVAKNLQKIILGKSTRGSLDDWSYIHTHVFVGSAANVANNLQKIILGRVDFLLLSPSD